MFPTRNTYVKIAAIAGLVLAFAAASFGKTHSDPAFSNIKISNFGRMDERFYRGARPKQKDFQALKDLGINTVIDLTDNTPDEKGYAEAAGLRSHCPAGRMKRPARASMPRGAASFGAICAVDLAGAEP